MHNTFVVDSESTVREMVELAVTNWLGAQRFGANDHDRKVGNSRGAVSRKCERNAEVLDHASVCAGINDAKRTPPPMSHAFADMTGNVKTMSIEASNPRD
jgi:hypothetical protein